MNYQKQIESSLAGSVSTQVEMSISGATRLELEGPATSLELRASGVSSVDHGTSRSPMPRLISVAPVVPF
ncbi:MAG: hypothetical protein VYD18_15655 [Candidatus Latescibacterota bacterium]|nr:hypothetical protein [Candidatus Latescibacterota bacterium]